MRKSLGFPCSSTVATVARASRRRTFDDTPARRAHASAGNERTPHIVSVSDVSDPMPRIFLIVSAVVHAALGMWVEVRGFTTHEPRVVLDTWAGHGIEVDATVGENPRSAEPPAPERSGEPEGAPSEKSSDATPSDAAPGVAVTSTAHLAKAASRARATPHRTEPALARPSDAPRPAAPDARSTTNGAQGAPAGAPEHGAESQQSSATTNGPFGAAGLPTGVRHLPKAFTRALGLASRGDPRWLALPPGTVGEVRFRLSVDEEGRLGALEVDPRDAARMPPVVEHMLENTRLLLVAGRFSLDASRERAGAQALRVRVVIDDAGASDTSADPTGLNELDYEPPAGSKPGRGSFRLNSGRRVIGWVYVE